MFVALETRRDIKTAADLPHLLAGDKPPKIFAGVAGRDEIARAEHPQTLGCAFCVDQAGGA